MHPSNVTIKLKEIATQMRGRAMSWELFPFSFREFLGGKGIDSEGALSTKKRLLIQKAFEEYWVSGGFPEIIGLDENLRTKTHQEYFLAVLFRDLVERHDISHPKAVSDLAHRLVDNTGSLYSVNRLTEYLQSLGVDFIVPLRGGSRLLVQVSESLVDPQTRNREIAALDEAMVETGAKSGTIVTRNEEALVDVESGTIKIVPAWRFLLDMPESTA